MDGLWDPPYYQGTEDTISLSLPYDVIEDTAINEKCCVQVLEILTSKADADIVEHEEVLMDLLSQLACTDELFSDMFLVSLKEKIDFLDSSIRKLKDDAEDFLSTSREPAESINDILKSLFCHYLQKTDLQFADNTGTASSSCSQVPADVQNKQVGSSSNDNQMKKIRTLNITPVVEQTISLAIVKVEEENTNYPHTVPAPLCWGFKKINDRQVRKFQMKNPIIVRKDILQNRTPRSNSICLKQSLETQGKWKHQTHDESMSLATVPSDVSMSLATVPSDVSMSLATVPYDESMSLATVPYVETSEETTAMSLATVPYVDSNEEVNAELKELDVPPGYPKPHHQKQSISRSRSLCSTRTYIRRKKPDSPLQTSSNSHPAHLMASQLDRAETCSNLYMEDRYITVSDLRAIAKQQQLKGFYKLRKAELAQLLGITLIEGKRKQPKRRDTRLVQMIK